MLLTQRNNNEVVQVASTIIQYDSTRFLRENSRFFAYGATVKLFIVVSAPRGKYNKFRKQCVKF